MLRDERLLRIGDGSSWTFFNGDWVDGEGGILAVPSDILRQDGPGMQGHHYAFFKDASYANLRARFEFRLMSHSDVGLIFRAADPSHFYLLHFPCCGQANRAQHFWAALSKMDASGYIKMVKLELVRRVPSNQGIWLDAEVTVRGEKVFVRVGEHGVFEAADSTFRGPGRVGMYLFGRADIRNLSIEGDTVPAGPWKEHIEPRRNWFQPCPDTEYGRWQKPSDLVRTPGGDLLLAYSVQERPYEGKVTLLSTRSSDNGRKWSKPRPIEVKGEEGWESARPHIFPDGRLRMFARREEQFYLLETEDDGRSWSAAKPVKIGPNPAQVERLHMPPQPILNLQDGSMLLFLYGGHASGIKHTDEYPTIWTWGSCHCQGFALRSTDGGLSWSSPVNIDSPGFRGDGTPYEGNLDLTEICGVQTGEGRIIALVRPVYSPWMWETWSADGGRSWGPCVRGPFPGYATPNMLRTRSGAILVAHRLPGLTIHTSLDDGRSWDQGTMIDSALWVMGSMIEIEPDLVLYVHFDSFESLMRAQFIRVTPSGLEPAG